MALEQNYLSMALVPASGSSLMPSVCQRLAASMERYHLPEPEREQNERLLEGEIKRDDQESKQALERRIADYKTSNGVLKRFSSWVSRGFRAYVPEVQESSPSPERELFQNLVDLQQAVERGYELLIGLPKVVEQMNQDYASLEVNERKLAEQIRIAQELLENIPETVRSYQQTREILANYDRRSQQEQDSIKDLLAATGTELPPVEMPEVRAVYLASIDKSLFQLQKSSLGSRTALALDQEELSRIGEDKTLLEQQYQELQKGWSPALRALHKLRSKYDSVKRFAPSAKLAIGMNNLRAETATLISESERVIANAVREIEDSDVRAQIAEDTDLEMNGLLNGK